MAAHHTCVRQGLQIVEECVGRTGRCWPLPAALPPNNYCFIYFWFMMRAPTRLLRQGGNIKFVQLYFPTLASHHTAISYHIRAPQFGKLYFRKSSAAAFLSYPAREGPLATTNYCLLFKHCCHPHTFLPIYAMLSS